MRIKPPHVGQTVWFFRARNNYDHDPKTYHAKIIRSYRSPTTSELYYEIKCDAPFVIGFASADEIFVTKKAVVHACNLVKEQFLIMRLSELKQEYKRVSDELSSTAEACDQVHAEIEKYTSNCK
jgi:hypothetical protein